MLCENCGKNKATYFFKQTKNGITTEKNLCAECAKTNAPDPKKYFYQIEESIPGDLFGGLLGSFFDTKPIITRKESCTSCGMTLGELLQNGKVGCAQCYDIFREALMPTVKKLHGNTLHSGKTPGDSSSSSPTSDTSPEKKEEQTAQEKILELRQRLARAIEKQEYEDAAKYRDMIKELEKEKKGDE